MNEVKQIESKRKGNRAEAVVISEFVKRDIPVLIPFGDNERYDIVIQIGIEFKKIQIKYGRLVNGCVVSNLSHMVGFKGNAVKTPYKSSEIDFIVIWCETLNKCYIVDDNYFNERDESLLRVSDTKNCISRINWAVDYELDKIMDNDFKFKQKNIEINTIKKTKDVIKESIFVVKSGKFVCEYCNNKHDGEYGSGRFCGQKCSRGFSTRAKRNEINEKVSKKIRGKYELKKLSNNEVFKRIKKEYIKECIHCNTRFTVVGKTEFELRKFCSHDCASDSMRKNKKINSK